MLILVGFAILVMAVLLFRPSLMTEPSEETAPTVSLKDFACDSGGDVEALPVSSATLSRRQKKNFRKRKQRHSKEVKSLVLSSSSCENVKHRPSPPSHYSKLGLGDAHIYYWIYSYCLDVESLKYLGFPLESALYPGKAVVYVDPDTFQFRGNKDTKAFGGKGKRGHNNHTKYPPYHTSTSTFKCLDANAKEFVPQPRLEDVRTCVRCFKEFHALREPPLGDKCNYHWGKAHFVLPRKGNASAIKVYSCCNSPVDFTTVGCCTADSHVWMGTFHHRPGLHGPLENFARTKKRKRSPTDGYHGVFALDGEMCYTASGMELIRLSVVGLDGRSVYDTLVWPENPVVDYNTRFSGISEQDLQRESKSNNRIKTLKEARNDLMGFVSAETILVGHSLQQDLRALRVIHTLVVDTSVLYPHPKGLPYRRSLKSLVARYLKKDIQTSSRGHDSLEDARASLELVLCQVKAEIASTRHKSVNPLTDGEQQRLQDLCGFEVRHSISPRFIPHSMHGAAVTSALRTHL